MIDVNVIGVCPVALYLVVWPCCMRSAHVVGVCVGRMTFVYVIGVCV